MVFFGLLEDEMSPIFDRFTRELVAILKAKGTAGLTEIAESLKPLLRDSEFAKFAFADPTIRKRVLFHDDDTDVYVLAHIHEAGKRGRPHSHGASWAIYGNVTGVTEMTEWRRINPAEEPHAVLEASSQYRLAPGDARAYPPHLIHSTAHPEHACVIRITGTDLDHIPRYGFDAARDRIVVPAPS
jgi:hypothetical protein